MSSASWLTRPRTTLLASLLATLGAVAAQDYSMAALFAVAAVVALAFSLLEAAHRASAVIAGADQLVEDRRSTRRSESASLRSTSTTA